MRKQVQGPIRNKQKTKEKILRAVGDILISKGFSHLKISNIATEAHVDKKLIYEYFGNLDGLINEYLSSTDYWTKVDNKKIEPAERTSSKNLIKTIIHSQAEALQNSKELQKIILWELSEFHPLLRELADKREEKGEILFNKFVDAQFKENTKLMRGITALLVAGTYYLNIHSESNGSLFCGLDLKNEKDRDAIRDAVNFILDAAYKEKSS